MIYFVGLFVRWIIGVLYESVNEFEYDYVFFIVVMVRLGDVVFLLNLSVCYGIEWIVLLVDFIWVFFVYLFKGCVIFDR